MSAASSDAYGPVGLRLRLSRPTRLEDRKHMVVAWVDEVELGRTTVQGTTLRAEFLRGGVECYWSGNKTVRILSLRMWSEGRGGKNQDVITNEKKIHNGRVDERTSLSNGRPV